MGIRGVYVGVTCFLNPYFELVLEHSFICGSENSQLQQEPATATALWPSPVLPLFWEMWLLRLRYSSVPAEPLLPPCPLTGHLPGVWDWARREGSRF